LEQEDYLKRQIDQLGRVLGKILADLTGLKARGQAGNGIEAADQALKNELNLDINELSSIPSGRFISTLMEDRKLSSETLEKLAEILFIIADTIEQSPETRRRSQELYERSLLLYEYTDKSSTTYSFDRHQKIENLKCLIGIPGLPFA
jgi:hypothetical protein